MYHQNSYKNSYSSIRQQNSIYHIKYDYLCCCITYFVLLMYPKYDYEYFIIYFFKYFCRTFFTIIAKFHIDTQYIIILMYN